MMRASAGILSPASTRTMSPGTISRAGTRWRSPSRTTVASGAASAISARTDFSARASCTIAEHRVEHHDHRDDDRLVGQGGFARILQQPFDHRDDDGDQQDDDQEVLELLEQPLPPRRFGRALELVRAVTVEALLLPPSVSGLLGIRAEVGDDASAGWSCDAASCDGIRLRGRCGLGARRF